MEAVSPSFGIIHQLCGSGNKDFHSLLLFYCLYYFFQNMHNRVLLFSALLAVVSAQQAGTQKEENHPSLNWKKCTADGCTEQKGSVVLDANWRWVHSTDGYDNCYTGNSVRFCYVGKMELRLTGGYSGTRAFALTTRLALRTAPLMELTTRAPTVSALTAMP